MQRRFRQIDVFTTEPYRGNPVAVVLDGDGLTTAQMQSIARWTNLSETTFVCKPAHPDADYRLHIFAPLIELPFAGHPTIGSAHAWLSAGMTSKQDGVVVQECGVGLVRIKTGGENIRVALPDARIKPFGEDVRAALEQAAGAPLLDMPELVDMGIKWLTAPVTSGEQLRALQPDIAALARIAIDADANGITLFGADETTIEVRSFAPHEGTNEDPVCGSGNGAVAYYLRQRRGPIDYLARQGRCVGSDGHITIEYEGETIWLGGQAVTCIEGSIVA